MDQGDRKLWQGFAIVFERHLENDKNGLSWYFAKIYCKTIMWSDDDALLGKVSG